MTTGAQVRVKLRSPADIVDAVPYLVGFEPHESLVVLSLRGPRSRLGLTARIDLPGAKSATVCARNFVGYLKRDGAARAIIVLYPPSDGILYPSVKPLADALTKHLTRARIEVCELLCVCDGRWWSMQCADAECCPPSGTLIAHDTTSELAAAMTVEGRVVLGSREELAAMLDPVGGVAAAAMVYAMTRIHDEVAARVFAGHKSEVVTESLALFRAAVDRGVVDAAGLVGSASELTVDEAARLIVSLGLWGVRDEVMTWFDGDRGDATRSLLLELVRRSVLPGDASALTVLAWVCYLRGEGVLAGIAVDRARTADPEYSLAELLDQVLCGAVNPSIFHDTIASPEFRRGLAAGG
jgi:drug/metabolite transporter superfamily protein YnfA